MAAMGQGRYWVATVPEEDYRGECLYAHDEVTVGGPGRNADTGAPEPGDPVALVAGTVPPVLFGLGRVTAAGTQIQVRYERRWFDHPVPVEGLGLPAGPPDPAEARAECAGLIAVPGGVFQRLARHGAGSTPTTPRESWLVSVALPIEASSRGEAVREFWSYVERLGPRELPAFVCPVGDELATQAYVLGGPTDLDPEQDDA
jgi:hypothetical protein